MQYVGCITIFLRSIVATCKSNKNGQFSTQLGLAKLSLEVKSKVFFFSRKDKTMSRKKHGLFVHLLGASYVQKGSEN